MKKNKVTMISAIFLLISLGFVTFFYNTIFSKENAPALPENVAFINLDVRAGDETNNFTYKIKSEDGTFETDVLLKGGSFKKLAVPTEKKYTIHEISSGNFNFYLDKENGHITPILKKGETEDIKLENTKKGKVNEGAITNVLQSAKLIDVDVQFAYYEKYSDGSYGFHRKGEGVADVNTLNENKTIIEDGYCLYDTVALEELLDDPDYERVDVSVKFNNSSTELLDLEYLESKYSKVKIDDQSNGKVNIIKLVNITAENEFVNLGGDETKPGKVNVNLLNLNYEGESRSICEDTWYNPLFSDIIYFDESKVNNDQKTFHIRTPRNLDNIDRVNENYGIADNVTGFNGIHHSEGITYLQTKDLNFADVTATVEKDKRYYKDGYLINDPNASINPNTNGEIVLNTFSGVIYDGQNNKIKNLTIDKSSGLDRGVTIFAFNNSTITNCIVENANLKKNEQGSDFGISALVGRNLKGRTVSDSKLTGLVTIESSGTNTPATGGLVATNWGENSIITNCVVETASGSMIKGHSSVGGIVGRSLGGAQVKQSKIANNAVLTISTATNSQGTFVGNFIGGIVGENHGTIGGSLQDACRVEGNLTLSGNYVGAIVGTNGFYDTINNKFSDGAKLINNCFVNGDVKVYGLVLGGIAGRNNGMISDSKVNGKLNINATGFQYAGGITGNNTADIDNCIVGGLTTDEIQIQATSYAGGITGNNGASDIIDVTATIKNTQVNTTGTSSKNISISSQGDSASQSFVGGIAGWNYGVIEQAKILGKTKIQGQHYAGGISGVNGDIAIAPNQSKAFIIGCLVTNEVTINGNYYVGGIVGQNNANIGSMAQNLASNKVTEQVQIKGTGHRVGGVAGWNYGVISQAEVLNATKIEGQNYTGGIAGVNGDDNIQANVDNAYIIGCIVNNDVTINGHEGVGGIVGQNNANIGKADEQIAVNKVIGQVQIRGTGYHVGGIAGYNNSVGVITGNSRESILVQGDGSGIKIVGQWYTGGIAGSNHAGQSNDPINTSADKAVFGEALIQYSKVDGKTEIGEVNDKTCTYYVGGIAGQNTFQAADMGGQQAQILNSTVGSDTNYIKVSSFYEDSFTIARFIENSIVKNTVGWVRKYNANNPGGNNFQYPGQN